MMTEQLGFSVLTAPIASLDRRALSQAWYSALHVAQNPASRASIKKACGAPPKTPPQATIAPERGRGAMRALAPAVSRTAVGPRASFVDDDRRAVRSVLARKIERVFLHPTRQSQRSTLTFGAARVHVSLQQSQGGLRLVAVCAPSQRSAVTRALEEARYALAARGIALGVAISEGERVH